MKHFKKEEFECRCWCGMPAAVLQNLEALVTHVLDPVREKYGRPIMVNSGYRCPEHNREVGGAFHSQHIKGEAADISVPKGTAGAGMDVREENLKLAKMIVENGEFDQLILEDVGKEDLKPKWVHVSYRRNGGNRHQVLKKIAGRRGYLKVY